MKSARTHAHISNARVQPTAKNVDSGCYRRAVKKGTAAGPARNMAIVPTSPQPSPP